jgi:hypothetical protein
MPVTHNDPMARRTPVSNTVPAGAPIPRPVQENNPGALVPAAIQTYRGETMKQLVNDTYTLTMDGQEMAALRDSLKVALETAGDVMGKVEKDLADSNGDKDTLTQARANCIELAARWTKLEAAITAAMTA